MPNCQSSNNKFSLILLITSQLLILESCMCPAFLPNQSSPVSSVLALTPRFYLMPRFCTCILYFTPGLPPNMDQLAELKKAYFSFLPHCLLTNSFYLKHLLSYFIILLLFHKKYSFPSIVELLVLLNFLPLFSQTLLFLGTCSHGHLLMSFTYPL